MKGILLLAYAHIKGRSTQSWLIGISLGLAIMLLTTAVGLLVALQKPFDLLFDQLKASHILLYFDSRSINEQEIVEWAKRQVEVESIGTSCPMVNIEQALIFKGKEIKGMLQLTERQKGNLQQDKLLIVNGKSQQHPKLGEIWLPQHLAKNHGIEIGDTLGMPVADGLYPLIVSAKVIDPHFASAILNPTRAWVAPGALPFMFPSTQLQQRMLGIRLVSTAVIEQFWHRFNLELDFDGSNLQYSLFKSVFLSFYNILGGILFIFSLLAIGLTFFIISANLSTALLADYQQTGILKTIGFTPQNIQMAYLLQYFSLFLLALPIGLLAAFAWLQLILDQLLHSLGLANIDFSFEKIALLNVVLLILLIAILIFYKSNSIKKIKAATAIRYGQAKAKPHFNWIVKKISQRLSLLWSLAFLQLNHNKKRTVYTGIGLLIAIFILNFAVDVSHSFSNMSTNKPMWGFEDSDLQLQLATQISIPLQHKDFINALKDYTEVKSILPFSYMVATIPTTAQKAPQEIVGKAYQAKLTELGLLNLEGEHPTEKGEISLCYFTAKQQQKRLGDTIQLFIEGQHTAFKVTGIYQDVSNLGQGFRLSMESLYALNPIFSPSRYALKLKKGVAVEPFKRQLQSDFGETIVLELSVEERREVQSVVMNMKGILVFLSIFFLVALAVVLFSDTLMSIREERRVFGLLKAIGATPFQSKRILIFKQIILFLLTFLISLPLVKFLTHRLISQLTTGIGLVEFPFSPMPFSTIIVLLFIFIFVIIVTYWASERAAKISSKKMKSILLTFLLLVGSLVSNQAQSLSEKVDNYLTEIYQTGIAPGFSVVVVKDQQILFKKAYGVEQMGSSRPFKPQTASAIGSLTKSFTALAVMQLVEQGKLDLDAPLIQYLPEFQTANKDKSDKITLRMLLNNTSGLRGNPSKSEELTTQTMERWLSSLKAQHLSREPGSAYEYSNTAFSLTGLLISRVSGLAYSDYLKKYIFEPLEMEHSSTDPEDFERLNVLHGHNMGLEQAIVAQASEASIEMIAAGSLLRSTAIDLGHYLIALLNGGHYKESQIIQQKSIDKMWHKEASFPGLSCDDGGDESNYYYGLGWMISEVDGREIIHHGGSTGTMSSFTMLYPTQKIAASILVNLDYNFVDSYRFKKLEHILNNLLHIAEGEPLSDFAIPQITDPSRNNFELPISLQTSYVGDYFLKESTPSVWFSKGLMVHVFKAPNGQLQAKTFKGKEVIAHFELDFSNPTLAIARYIGYPTSLQFKLNPRGKVIHLYLNGAVFHKLGDTFFKKYTSIHLQNSPFSFYLPKSWQIQKNKTAILWAHQQSSDNRLVVKWLKSSPLNATAFFLQEFPTHQILHTGLLQRVEKAGRVWWEQSFISELKGQLLKHFVLQTKLEEGRLYVILTGSDEEWTKEVQELAEGMGLY